MWGRRAPGTSRHLIIYEYTIYYITLHHLGAI